MVGAPRPARARRSPGTRSRIAPGHDRVLADLARTRPSVSLPGLSRIRLETASLPTSCSSAARRRSLSSSSSAPSAAARPSGDHARAVGVAVGPRRLRVDHAGERVGDRVEARLVGHRAAGRRGSHGDDVAARAALARSRVSRQTAPSASTSARVEPAAAAPARDRQRRLDAAVGVEDLGRLGEAEDAPEQRDLLAAQAARLAAAVPVLVERADRLGRLGLEAEQVRDLGAAVAARLHQRARDLALVLDGEQALDALARSEPPGATVRSAHTNAGKRPRPVHALGGALGARGRRPRTAPPSGRSWPSSPASLSSSA